MIAKLADDHKSWEKDDRERYGGQQIEVSDERDHKGRRLCLVLSGPLAGERRWMKDDEIAMEDRELMPESPQE